MGGMHINKSHQITNMKENFSIYLHKVFFLLFVDLLDEVYAFM